MIQLLLTLDHSRLIQLACSQQHQNNLGVKILNEIISKWSWKPTRIKFLREIWNLSHRQAFVVTNLKSTNYDFVV